MSRVLSIPDGDESRGSSRFVPESVVTAQVYASLSRTDTLLLASLTVFPAAFDVRAGAAVAGKATDEFIVTIDESVARGITRASSSSQPPLFQLTEGARAFLIRLPIAQDEICAARSRHDDYFLAGFTDTPAEPDPASTSEPYREFKKTNLELAARRQIRRLVGLPAGAGGRPDGLTQRQWEVAQLVATGRTNFQIGQTMAISEWTVVNHLRMVMRRLGCSSRVDVARAVLS